MHDVGHNNSGNNTDAIDLCAASGCFVQGQMSEKNEAECTETDEVFFKYIYASFTNLQHTNYSELMP
jgi:hypothetical protein